MRSRIYEVALSQWRITNTNLLTFVRTVMWGFLFLVSYVVQVFMSFKNSFALLSNKQQSQSYDFLMPII